MKLTVFFLLFACLAGCLAGGFKREVLVGRVTGRVVGTHPVVVASSMLQTKTHTFTYPQVPALHPIQGIEHFDYKSHPVTVNCTSIDVYNRQYRIDIKSQFRHGINSTFVFHY